MGVAVSADLRCADCLGPDGMAALADGSVDVVICDPPYEAEAHTQQRRVKRGAVVANEPLPFPPITAAERDGASMHMARLARRWILVFCQVEAAMAWRTALEQAGARYMRTCIWVKPDGQPQLSGDRPGMGYESIVACHVGTGRSRWNGGGKTGVYVFNKNGDLNGVDQRIHTTQKPVALMEQLLADFTDPGELILDPYAGSGTTAVAAARLGRRFVGFERDAEMHAKAVQRLSRAVPLPTGYQADPRQGILL